MKERQTGCMYPVQLIRVHLADAEHEGTEPDVREARGSRESVSGSICAACS